MLSLPSSVRIYLSGEPTDMRKQHNGLLAIVQYHWELDPFSGHMFVFINKRGDRAKILFWDNGGFVLVYKRLEKGKFKRPRGAQSGVNVSLDATELAMLLDGIDVSKVRRPRKWRPVQKVLDSGPKK